MADHKPAGNGQKTDEAAKAAEAKDKAPAEAKAAEDQTADTSWQDRLIVERDELAIKLDKLNDYLKEVRKDPKNRNKDFEDIPDDGTLLQVQRNAMAQYKAALDARISNL